MITYLMKHASFTVPALALAEIVPCFWHYDYNKKAYRETAPELILSCGTAQINDIPPPLPPYSAQCSVDHESRRLRQIDTWLSHCGLNAHMVLRMSVNLLTLNWRTYKDVTICAVVIRACSGFIVRLSWISRSVACCCFSTWFGWHHISTCQHQRHRWPGHLSVCSAVTWNWRMTSLYLFISALQLWQLVNQWRQKHIHLGRPLPWQA
jgi:hypothetical protein